MLSIKKMVCCHYTLNLYGFMRNISFEMVTSPAPVEAEAGFAEFWLGEIETQQLDLFKQTAKIFSTANGTWRVDMFFFFSEYVQIPILTWTRIEGCCVVVGWRRVERRLFFCTFWHLQTFLSLGWVGSGGHNTPPDSCYATWSWCRRLWGLFFWGFGWA